MIWYKFITSRLCYFLILDKEKIFKLATEMVFIMFDIDHRNSRNVWGWKASLKTLLWMETNLNPHNTYCLQQLKTQLKCKLCVVYHEVRQSRCVVRSPACSKSKNNIFFLEFMQLFVLTFIVPIILPKTWHFLS